MRPMVEFEQMYFRQQWNDLYNQHCNQKHQKQKSESRFRMDWSERKPCLLETMEADWDQHYIYHTAWAFRKMLLYRPKRHVDIGSSLYFIGMASAIVPIEFVDLRSCDLQLPGVVCKRGDLVELSNYADESVPSLSCLHVLEHVGLGRYGDRLDYNGDKRGASELSRILAPGGMLLFAVPVGRDARIEFNAHRVYRYDQVLEDLFPELVLEDFALVTDDRRLLEGDIAKAACDKQTYGCGCFWFSNTSGSVRRVQ